MSEEESRHAVRVLRLKKGDEFILTDGKGHMVSANIARPDVRHCEFETIKITFHPKRKFSIHLAVAPTKNVDRMEWMTEKCVEAGIDSLSFVHCSASDRKSINLQRMEKVAVSAMKQSQQAWLPVIASIVPFEKFVSHRQESQKFIAHAGGPEHLAGVAPAGSDYVVLVGPEGDFTVAELARAQSCGFRIVSLGPNRLRTETAGLTAVIALNLINH